MPVLRRPVLNHFNQFLVRKGGILETKAPKILIAIVVAFVTLLVVAYFGAGYVIYDKLGNVAGSCDRHQRTDRQLRSAARLAGGLRRYALLHVLLRGGDPRPARQGSRSPRLVDPDRGSTRPRPAVLVLDGLGGCKNSISVLVPTGMLWRNGFNVLVVNVRDTGKSTFDDLRSTIGNDKYHDVLGAWDWLSEQEGLRALQRGHLRQLPGRQAMANYAFAEEPRITTLFLHATFGDLQTIIKANRTQRLPDLPVNAGSRHGQPGHGREPVRPQPGGDDPRRHGTAGIHCAFRRADTRIDSSQSELLAAANREAGVKVSTWFPENGQHMQIPAAYPQEFEQRMVGFFHENLQAVNTQD